MNQTANLPTIRVDRSVTLPDNDQWRFRFEVPSEHSDRLYTIAQHKEKKHWGCSCMGWKRHRKCHHLTEIGLPNFEKPFEVNFIKE